MSRRLGILISGRGSNLQSIIDAIRSGELDATIAVVVSNRAEAAGLLRAREAGLETVCVRQRDFESRDACDAAVVDVLRAHAVDLVCLAGFMRLIGAPLLEAFPNRILNIHPSLLPAFPGLDAQGQALEHGVRVSGATVHLVTAELDSGPIVLQARRAGAAGRYGREPLRAHPHRGAPSVSEGDRTGPRWSVAHRRTPVHHWRYAAPLSVSTATSGGQAIRTGT